MKERFNRNKVKQNLILTFLLVLSGVAFIAATILALVKYGIGKV